MVCVCEWCVCVCVCVGKQCTVQGWLVQWSVAHRVLGHVLCRFTGTSELAQLICSRRRENGSIPRVLACEHPESAPKAMT